MNRIDKLYMDLGLKATIYFQKFLYFFMFRNFKECKGFCLTCNQKHFEDCCRCVSKQYKLEKQSKEF